MVMRKPKPVSRSGWGHLYPFTSRFANRNGLRYHYLDEGSGEPVIMVHGNPTWSFFFRELIKGLSNRYRLIVPDHIGCGLSEKPGIDRYDFRLRSRVDDLDQLIGMLNLKGKLTFVLHDWGGVIGLAAALRQPERVGRIVIFNTAAFLPPPGKRLPMRLRIVRNVNTLAAPAVLGLNLFVRGALSMASCRRLDRTVQAGLKAPYNSWNNRLATLMFVRDIPLSPADPSHALVKFVDDNLYRLKDHPVLVCWGEQDFVFDRDYLAEWRRRFPAAEVHSFPDAGHYLLEDVPGPVLNLVDRFLKRNPL